MTCDAAQQMNARQLAMQRLPVKWAMQRSVQRAMQRAQGWSSSAAALPTLLLEQRLPALRMLQFRMLCKRSRSVQQQGRPQPLQLQRLQRLQPNDALLSFPALHAAYVAWGRPLPVEAAAP